ncbi:uncharacterized protein N7483_004287 [Penicillium malachiteum]|uniref:uncharacterized protein n=1 Tax=Penicillium malachiteum TaxID=1324776 RepID=UPI002548DA0E|nr:uncharacterized protein N7483_004287 [Penicillium malachiteum]KAJ5729779.1 hypothetical protein N7483_004287 [Penicillium malachiteum]
MPTIQHITSAAFMALAFQMTSALSTQEANVTVTNSTACASVHMILGRGSTETVPGSLESLVTLVTADFPEANYENIDYPATDETTSDSYFLGRVAAAKQLIAYREKCPESKIVVLGYSEGALCIDDAITGSSGNEYLGNVSQPLVPIDVTQSVTALVLYGNPRHMPYQPYNVFNLTQNVTGKYPKTKEKLAYFNKAIGSATADYCNVNDIVCASGTSLTAHESYTDVWNYDAAAFIKSKILGN